MASEQQAKPIPIPQPTKPLSHYMKTGRINLDRLSKDDRATVICWLRLKSPAMLDAMIEMKKTFGEETKVPYIDIDPNFWFWLADCRAQERKLAERSARG